MRSPAERALRAGAVVAALVLAACGPAPTTVPAPTVGHSMPPRAVRTPPPAYPEALGCDGVGGRVDLRITIDPQGRVGGVKLQKSSGHAALDQTAIEAVRGWEFAAATRGGQPVSSTIAVPMTFNPPVERPDRCFALDEQR